MSYNLEAGDLVTVRPFETLAWTPTIPARRTGTTNWTLRLPSSSIMTVAETPTVLPWSQMSYVTVLLDGQLLEVFLHNVERVGKTDDR